MSHKVRRHWLKNDVICESFGWCPTSANHNALHTELSLPEVPEVPEVGCARPLAIPETSQAMTDCRVQLGRSPTLVPLGRLGRLLVKWSKRRRTNVDVFDPSVPHLTSHRPFCRSCEEIIGAGCCGVGTSTCRLLDKKSHVYT